MKKKIIALVPAAGVGARARADVSSTIPKQYMDIGGMPMLRRSVLALLAEPRVSQVRVIVSPQDNWIQSCLEGLARTVWRPCGGATRALTVQQGLEDAALGEHDWVLVHDAARPGLPLACLRRLIDDCMSAEQGGLLALPVADTVKQQRINHTPTRVQQTIDRSQLWLAQTPQFFPAQALLHNLQQAQRQQLTITDESSAMEAAGYQPLLVTGAMENFKVTWPNDFALMERWL